MLIYKPVKMEVYGWLENGKDCAKGDKTGLSEDQVRQYPVCFAGILRFRRKLIHSPYSVSGQAFCDPWKPFFFKNL
jgi:hypothetical protein